MSLQPSRKRGQAGLRRVQETALALALVLAFWALLSATPAFRSVTTRPMDDSGDVTAAVERLGNPFTGRYPGDANIYPRNVWDMQLFEGRIYLGSGNSANSGPAANAGPVDVWAFDLHTDQFVNEYTVAEEQLDVYRILNGRLVIPGRDPRESWDFGNFYRREADGWHKYRTLPNTIHTYDMLQVGARLFASINPSDNAGGVAISDDDGQTWTRVPVGRGAAFGLFTLGDHLFAAKSIPTDPTLNSVAPADQAGLMGVHEYQSDGQFQPRPDLTFGVLFPGISQGQAWEHWGQMVRYVNFQGKLVYIGGETLHQVIPFGLFVLDPAGHVQRVSLPAGALPWDTLVRDDTLYVLLAAKQPSGGYAVSVIATSDLVAWRELFHFQSATFARSFEMDQGDFYFGLGTGVGPSYDPRTWEMSPAAGDILRVARGAYTPAERGYTVYLPLLES